jgi:hypothetical protein
LAGKGPVSYCYHHSTIIASPEKTLAKGAEAVPIKKEQGAEFAKKKMLQLKDSGYASTLCGVLRRPALVFKYV